MPTMYGIYGADWEMVKYRFGGLEHFVLFHFVGYFIIPIDKLMFNRKWLNHQPENSSFKDDFPMKRSICKRFSMAMSNSQMVKHCFIIGTMIVIIYYWYYYIIPQ